MKLGQAWVSRITDPKSDLPEVSTIGMPTKRKPAKPKEVRVRIRCQHAGCNTEVEVPESQVDGWKLGHQAAEHFGHPWEFTTKRV